MLVEGFSGNLRDSSLWANGTTALLVRQNLFHAQRCVEFDLSLLTGRDGPDPRLAWQSQRFRGSILFSKSRAGVPLALGENELRRGRNATLITAQLRDEDIDRGRTDERDALIDAGPPTVYLRIEIGEGQADIPGNFQT